ncbi:MAG: L-threonylcarbamoyladenylate synthase [Acidimicrobiia bacterium]
MSAPVVDPELLARAVELLRDGGLVAFPTETVYGLGADATNAKAIERLFAVKGRPVDHPVIVHGADQRVLDAWGREVPDVARGLAREFWPGPLTIVVRRALHVIDEVTGGLDTVGLRVPDQSIALALLHEFGGGVAAPSANRFGRVSPTTAADVRCDLEGDVDLVLDGGPCAVGVESTIVDCSTDQVVLLRPGGVPVERIRAIAGREVRERRAGDPRAPGGLASHYAPRARVELVGRGELATRARALDDAGDVVGVLALGAVRELPAGARVLGTPVDVAQYARDLYACLRAADAQALDVVLAVPPPEEGVGIAVVDRLRRAAGGVVESEP